MPKRINQLAQQAGIGCWIGGMLESAVGAGICVELAAMSNMVYPTTYFPQQVLYGGDFEKRTGVFQPGEDAAVYGVWQRLCAGGSKAKTWRTVAPESIANRTQAQHAETVFYAERAPFRIETKGALMEAGILKPAYWETSHLWLQPWHRRI